MDTEKGVTEELLGIDRPIYEHECKKEYRQHYRMKKLRYETSENRRKLTHFLSHFRCDKITK